MLTKRYEVSDGIFHCADCTGKESGTDRGICITAYEGKAETLFIPSRIEERPVAGIGKKAFLGNQYLQHMIFPDTIESVGDWACSGCRSLQRVTMPKREIVFGRQVFQKTKNLYEISITGDSDSFSRLLAAAVTILEADYLLVPMQAGSAQWYHNLDARITAFLEESEESALKNLVYCAEEDMADKQERCLRELAQTKAYLAFLRLIYPERIEDAMQQRLTEYLRRRTKGCKDESAWEVVKKERRSKLSYCDKLYEIGGIREENVNAMLDDLGENNIELKAHLLKKWQDRKKALPMWEALRWE